MGENKLDNWRGLIWTGVPYLMGVTAGAVDNRVAAMIVGVLAGALCAFTNGLVRDLLRIKRYQERQAELMMQEQMRSVMMRSAAMHRHPLPAESSKGEGNG